MLNIVYINGMFNTFWLYNNITITCDINKNCDAFQEIFYFILTSI